MSVDIGRSERRLARSPWLLGALSLVLLCLGPVSIARAESFGSISGQVTEASSKAPLQGIEVCAISTRLELFEEEEESQFEHVFRCVKTGAGGEYTIPELRPESFYVIIGPVLESNSDYIVQVYEGKLSLSEATPVAVVAEKTTPNIDAELSRGAEISGRLTNAETGAPVEHAFACALRTNASGQPEAESCGLGEANGAYTIRGLPTGSYKVGFLASGFQLQYYNDKLAEAEAEMVSVTAPLLTEGIDDAMKPKSLSTGSMSPGSGSATAEANPAEASPTKPQGAKKLSIAVAHRRITVTGDGDAVVKLHCTTATSCSAKLTLKAKETITVDGRKRQRTVTIARSGVLQIAAGKDLTTRIRLDPRARALLSADHGQLVAELALGGEHDEAVTLVRQTANAES